jgi:hypothetical protein
MGFWGFGEQYVNEPRTTKNHYVLLGAGRAGVGGRGGGGTTEGLRVLRNIKATQKSKLEKSTNKK